MVMQVEISVRVIREMQWNYTRVSTIASGLCKIDL